MAQALLTMFSLAKLFASRMKRYGGKSAGAHEWKGMGFPPAALLLSEGLVHRQIRTALVLTITLKSDISGENPS